MIRDRLNTAAPVMTVLGLAVALTTSAATAARNPTSVFLFGYLPLQQTQPLTCEAAATSMATRGVIREAMIMSRVASNADPNLGYRGNPDGPYVLPGLPNYGVYPAPLARVMTSFGWTTKPIHGATRYGLKRYLSFGWPVVVWVTLDLTPESAIWVRHDGRRFFLVPEEHALLAIGYTKKQIIVDDPHSGERTRYLWSAFMRSWSELDRMALAVQPCPAPTRVTDITATRAFWTVTWKWPPVPRAAGYDVWVFRHINSTWRFIKRFESPATSFTAHGSVASEAYLIRVRAVAPCRVEGEASYSYVPAIG